MLKFVQHAFQSTVESFDQPVHLGVIHRGAERLHALHAPQDLLGFSHKGCPLVGKDLFREAHPLEEHGQFTGDVVSPGVHQWNPFRLLGDILYHHLDKLVLAGGGCQGPYDVYSYPFKLDHYFGQ